MVVRTIVTKLYKNIILIKNYGVLFLILSCMFRSLLPLWLLRVNSLRRSKTNYVNNKIKILIKNSKNKIQELLN